MTSRWRLHLPGLLSPYHPRCWKDIQGLLFKCLFRTQCNARKILIKTILQKKLNRTAPAPCLLPVFPLVFTFSSCHFPYGCQNFPFWGMVMLGIWLSSVYQQNLFCTLFIYHSSHLKAQFKQVTRRYKRYKEIWYISGGIRRENLGRKIKCKGTLVCKTKRMSPFLLWSCQSFCWSACSDPTLGSCSVQIL